VPPARICLDYMYYTSDGEVAACKRNCKEFWRKVVENRR